MRRRNILKKLISPVLVPVTRAYLKKERSSHFLGLHLTIPPGVFHPALFFSTKTMCKFLMQQDLHQKKILEIGCGSGAISIVAAKGGAKVYACDINPDAVKATLDNATRNNVEIGVIRSDLFESIEEKNFDWILNNPPYYPKDPSNPVEHAWYAGSNWEYFQRLFKETKDYLSPHGKLLLVLSDECNLISINEIAEKSGFTHQLIYTRSLLMEKTYILQYEIAI
jgi:release factor glutamine methyltransferase